ncbi:hypothetical protein CTheo_7199 [Ceratobasidium theobromae]|uniref:Uncharacterized protein n=1 Tax=Ceratobasidium theobromae TaxID=1582974 RepID=A0A5N5QD25_9AGAM|nr:hypothetical protein CTheo_7199 [Ceratobasidium theobromae]
MSTPLVNISSIPDNAPMAMGVSRTSSFASSNFEVDSPVHDSPTLSFSVLGEPGRPARSQSLRRRVTSLLGAHVPRFLGIGQDSTSSWGEESGQHLRSPSPSIRSSTSSISLVDFRGSSLSWRNYFPPRKLQSFYLKHVASDERPDGIRDEIVTSARYYDADGKVLIRFAISNRSGSEQRAMILQPPPRGSFSIYKDVFIDLLDTSAPNNILRSISSFAPIIHHYGLFCNASVEDADQHIASLFGVVGSFKAEYKYTPPLPLDEVVVLTHTITSRCLHYVFDTPLNHWFIQAMWEGMIRLKDRDLAIESDIKEPSNKEPSPLDEYLDNVMEQFGSNLFKFHQQILRAQQGSERCMKAQESRNASIKEDIERRNQLISRRQASINATILENERMKKDIRLLEEKLRERELSASPVPAALE